MGFLNNSESGFISEKAGIDEDCAMELSYV